MSVNAARDVRDLSDSQAFLLLGMLVCRLCDTGTVTLADLNVMLDETRAVTPA